MSQRTLPLLFFNLGGEMLYILHQRLHAQNVLTGKTARVMQDMVGTMFGGQWLEELFQPQPMVSREGLQSLLQKVAHSSIMRLNSVALEKLYDLISMSFKYQLMACPRPEDIILVTLNHLDSLKGLVADSQQCREMVHTACRKLNEHYSPLLKAEFITLRSTLLSLFQNSHKRITVMMRLKLQHQNGRFVMPVEGPVPVGFEIPGTIRYYSEGEVTHTDHFQPALQYSPPLKQGSWEMVGDRVTSLGLNIYQRDSTSRSKQREVSEGVLERPDRRRGSSSYRDHGITDEDTQEDVAAGLATVELSLLHRLLVPPQHTDKDTTFRLDLFPKLEDSGSSQDSNSSSPTEIDSRKKGNILHLETHHTSGKDELHKIRDDFTTSGGTGPTADEDDLLDLLDQAIA